MTRVFGNLSGPPPCGVCGSTEHGHVVFTATAEEEPLPVAKGDGVTDDTAAIQAAINRASKAYRASKRDLEIACPLAIDISAFQGVTRADTGALMFEGKSAAEMPPQAFSISGGIRLPHSGVTITTLFPGFSLPPGAKLVSTPPPKRARRKHSRDGAVFCPICDPFRCRKAP